MFQVAASHPPSLLGKAMKVETSTESTPPKARNDSALNCLQDILKLRAECSCPGFMTFYPLSAISLTSRRISYASLYHQAKSLGVIVAGLSSFRQGAPVLIHLDDHWDNILSFWSILFAGSIPVLSSPLSNVQDHRVKHIRALSELLEAPICITRTSLLNLFEDGAHSLQLLTLESLLNMETTSSTDPYTLNGRSNNTTRDSTLEDKKDASSTAVLMLTSGSTGNAKAVCLTHKQILSAVSGKASMRPLPKRRAFLNWIGLDHVANLAEIHLQALWLGVDQIHAHAADIVSSPHLFLDLLSRHQVCRSFAPNFFLHKLVSACAIEDKEVHEWDLSNFVSLISGGEANDVSTCIAASALLQKYGAAKNVITPGFGMTETCAGSIYNLACPDYDVSQDLPVATLGHCIPGIEMRVVDSATGQSLLSEEEGNLQVRGEVVFKSYYRNPTATAEAFTTDSWFRTGDQAIIDSNGHLRLIGRLKNTVNINGVKISISDIQASLEIALKDTCAARVVVFPSRNQEDASEQITVAYIPTHWPPQAEEIAVVDAGIVQGCMMVTSACRPWIFALSPQALPFVPQSTLGKISAAKMRTIFESGTFGDVTYHRQAVEGLKKQQQMTLEDEVLNDAESALCLDFASIKGVEDPIRADTSIFDLGFTSMDIIRLKHLVENRLQITVPTILLMKSPTVRLLASSLEQLALSNIVADGAATVKAVSRSNPYDPVVRMCSTGHKTPLWLVHPGVGEVFVFVGLAKCMQSDDRPVYALRARGFEPGEAIFSSIEEAVDTYVSAVRERQPRGPYALAGYSYGTMLAFEMAKKLQTPDGESEVQFLGSFNLPPHIKTRMRQLSWNMCLLHLTQFLGMLDENHELPKVLRGGSSYNETPPSEALEYVLANADDSRMLELGLSRSDIAHWANIAYGLQSMAVNYEPSGCVPVIDVFHAEPLKVAASSRLEWLADHLSKWQDFCASEPRFIAVGGAHYTMIGSEFVVAFSNALQAALAGRGL